MKLDSLFQNYELMVDRVDAVFHRMEKDYSSLIKCQKFCSDCCYAVFGLFIIEAVYIKMRFDRIDQRDIYESILRCDETERAIRRLEVKLMNYEDDPEMQSLVYATERVRCPLLSDEDKCVIYPYRPITCRVYGIPTKIRGRARVCGKSGFKSGNRYPVFDLDAIYGELFILSKELLEMIPEGDPEKAPYLVSISKVLTTPTELLIKECFA
jgi:Fe-S-cluster containining protein